MLTKFLACVAAGATITLSVPQSARAQSVTYYEVPKGDGPHDVAPASDGAVWNTGQRAGVLGRLDPKTGQIDRIELGDGSAPHGVIVGPDGAPWVTDAGLNAIPRRSRHARDQTLAFAAQERRRQSQHCRF
jgi:virginiamycin B lyase